MNPNSSSPNASGTFHYGEIVSCYLRRTTFSDGRYAQMLFNVSMIFYFLYWMSQIQSASCCAGLADMDFTVCLSGERSVDRLRLYDIAVRGVAKRTNLIVRHKGGLQV